MTRSIKDIITTLSQLLGIQQLKKLGIFIALIFFAMPVSASDINGKVIAVVDGNTLEISGTANEKMRISLLGVDSPELGQEFGSEAKAYLEKLVLKKDVVVALKGKDRTGNYLGVVKVNGKVDAGVELLKAGLAWTTEKNPDTSLEAYRMWAQKKEKGLWKQANPVPPWKYRREQSMSAAKGR